MNHDATPTPRTEIYVLNPHPPCVSAEFARELERELTEKTNEVARLRELLTMALRWIPVSSAHQKEQEAIREELALLAPAPEEPVNPTCHNTTHKFSHCDCHRRERMVCDKCQKTDEPAPDWRELGPDEVIQEGDEIHLMGRWFKVGISGKKPSEYVFANFRTRRPLPVQEMPLDDEIETIREYSEHIDSLTGHMAVKALAKSIRYLRDEIQKLKDQPRLPSRVLLPQVQRNC